MGGLGVDILAEETGQAFCEVFNLLGEKVRSVASWSMVQGTPYTWNWDGRNDRGQIVGSGVYLLVLRSPSGVLVKKVMVARR